MTAYAAVNILSLIDAAYIAGLIDGEGSITLTQEHRNERRQLVVSIANTELALLKFVRQAAGAGRITRKRTYSAIHTPSRACLGQRDHPVQALAANRANHLLADCTSFRTLER
jgi:LAGLIDADG-like domain